jgi:hypothetical protein
MDAASAASASLDAADAREAAAVADAAATRDRDEAGSHTLAASSFLTWTLVSFASFPSQVVRSI